MGGKALLRSVIERLLKATKTHKCSFVADNILKSVYKNAKNILKSVIFYVIITLKSAFIGGFARAF